MNTPKRKRRVISGADQIKTERARARKKGHGNRHDDRHSDKSLITNARDTLQSYLNAIFAPPPGADLWECGRRHHANKKKLLLVAGQLVAAEIERIDRAEVRKQKRAPKPEIAW